MTTSTEGKRAIGQGSRGSEGVVWAHIMRLSRHTTAQCSYVIASVGGALIAAVDCTAAVHGRGCISLSYTEHHRALAVVV
eukprot:5863-Heterococcus_DN1.PRE.4